jgi:NAD(P)H-quinone oxidoreductase subunit 3
MWRLFFISLGCCFSHPGIVGLVEALIFIAILVVALVYAWRKGALEWS